MNRAIIIIFLIAPLTGVARAAPKPARRPSGDVAGLSAVIQFGDKQTNFDLREAAGKFTIALHNSVGQSAVRELTPADFNFLIAEYNKLPVVGKVPDVCYRSRVDITISEKTGFKHKESCYGTKTITEPAYRAFVGHLALPF